ncbi:hypothetical protein CSV73_14485 [Sporosarcina sp. P1]|nr:hypothetical protein CSV73_14485 [Sporosarcina sp. P1]
MKVVCLKSTHVPDDIEQVHLPKPARPITKELKNINNKTTIEKNFDLGYFIIQYVKEKTGEHITHNNNC